MNTTIKTTSKDGSPLFINIRLSDPCKNGHNDFAITANMYKKGSAINDNNIDACGCLHDEILAVKPSLQLFVDLHLSDEQGLPMYAVENGYYWFSKDIAIFAKYMRIPLDKAKELRAEIFDKQQFTKWVETMKPTYLSQANEAKKQLAQLIEKTLPQNS